MHRGAVVLIALARCIIPPSFSSASAMTAILFIRQMRFIRDMPSAFILTGYHSTTAHAQP
jgi:hypothetical protein